MASQIRISPDTMRERAASYKAEAETIESVVSKLDALLSNLEAEWEGAASTAFITKYDELRPAFQSVQELVTDIGNALEEVANNFEADDEAMASAFNS